MPAQRQVSEIEYAALDLMSCELYPHCSLMRVQVIVVMDPATSSKPRLHMTRMSTSNAVAPKEKRYVFDKAYDGNTDNRTLYYGTVKVQETAGLQDILAVYEAPNPGLHLLHTYLMTEHRLLLSAYSTRHELCRAAMDKQS